MKISGEQANFEIDTGSINYAGAFTNESMTYNVNVDLRLALGDIYNKYDSYLMVFNGISMYSTISTFSTTTGITGLGSTAVWTLGMSGLNWANNTYNGNINQIAYFPNRYTMPINNAYTTTNAVCNNGIVFRKSGNPNVTLSLTPYLTRQGGAGLANGTGAGGWDINYNFTIFGLSE